MKRHKPKPNPWRGAFEEIDAAKGERIVDANKISPCRICGKYPQTDLDDDGWVMIGCDTPDCWNSTLGGLNHKRFNTEADAVIAWNIAQEETDGENDPSPAG